MSHVIVSDSPHVVAPSRDVTLTELETLALRESHVLIVNSQGIELRSFDTALGAAAIDRRAAGWASRRRLVVAWQGGCWGVFRCERPGWRWATKQLAACDTPLDAVLVAQAALAL